MGSGKKDLVEDFWEAHGRSVNKRTDLAVLHDTDVNALPLKDPKQFHLTMLEKSMKRKCVCFS